MLYQIMATKLNKLCPKCINLKVEKRRVSNMVLSLEIARIVLAIAIVGRIEIFVILRI